MSVVDDQITAGGTDYATMSGHWILARLGKKVLRPGGQELTARILRTLDIGEDDDVVEIAPGLGVTTERILDRNPRRYRGIDRDPSVVRRLGSRLGDGDREVVEGSGTDTGLPAATVDVVFGEAFLTMQPDSVKDRVFTEYARILRPGGRMALHEVMVDGGAVAVECAHKDLTGNVKVSVNPLTADEWVGRVESHGFRVIDSFSRALALLEPSRIIEDEGFVGAARFAFNLMREHEARGRVLEMRTAMRRHRGALRGLGLIAERLDG